MSRFLPANAAGSIHVSDPGSDGHLNTDSVPGSNLTSPAVFPWQYVHFGLKLLGQADNTYTVPTFADACQVAAVTDAIYRSGREDGRLVKVGI